MKDEHYRELLRELAAPEPPSLTSAVLAELDRRGVFHKPSGWPLWLRKGLVVGTAACYLLLTAWLGWLARPVEGHRTLTPEQARVWARLPSETGEDPFGAAKRLIRTAREDDHAAHGL